jgi:hypothetical protein
MDYCENADMFLFSNKHYSRLTINSDAAHLMELLSFSIVGIKAIPSDVSSVKITPVVR